MTTSLAPEVKQWAINILDKLFENGFEEVLIFDGVKGKSQNKWIDENEELLEEMNLFISNGCTKLCIIPTDGDWVIKINYNSRYRDYCHDEVRNYKRAEAAGIGEYFARSYELDKDYTYFIEIQEKVETSEDDIGDKFYSYVSSSYNKEDFEDEDEYSEAVEEDICDMSEEERLRAVFEGSNNIDETTLQKLIEFVDNYEINDLHEGNIAIRPSTGHYVLMDYSGY